MNMNTSEYSRGCESGWTTYLDQSLYSADRSGASIFTENYRYKAERLEDYEGDEDEDEGLSMVSDASSGPPHFNEDEDYCCEIGYLVPGSSVSQVSERNKKNKKKKIKEQRVKTEHSYLEDTASSPIKNHPALPRSRASMDHPLGLSQGFSTTHLKGKSSLQKRFGFFRSSVPGQPAAGATGGLQGRKWE
ncbi:hypothetical protein NMG60_11016538 [Bertholletia excelsa]